MPAGKLMLVTKAKKPFKPRSFKTGKLVLAYKGKSRNKRRENYSGTIMKGPFKRYNQIDPFAPSKFVKLTYSETASYTTGASGTMSTDVQFSLNSLYDPNITGVGHQPYGFDQLAALYKRYKVSGALVTITLTDPSEDGIVFGAMLLPPGGTATMAGQGADTVKEQPMSITRSLNDSGSQVTIIKQYVPIHVLAGLTKLQFKADTSNYGALVSASPTLQPKINMSLGSFRASGAATCIVRIQITYYAQFYDRIVQAAS